MCITSTSRAVDRSTSQTTATIQTGGYCNLHFFGLVCWYLNWESWASSNPNQPVMTSQLSTHFEKLQLRHVHLGAGAAWKQISAWKCCTRWGLLKMMPYEFLNLHVDHRWSNFSRWTSSCFFLITGWCYTEIRWICVRIGAHAFEVGHFWPTDSEEPRKRRNKEFKDLKN